MKVLVLGNSLCERSLIREGLWETERDLSTSAGLSYHSLANGGGHSCHVWIGDLHPVSSQAELRIWIHFSNVLKMTLSLFLIPSKLSNYTLSSKKKKNILMQKIIS